MRAAGRGRVTRVNIPDACLATIAHPAPRSVRYFCGRRPMFQAHDSNRELLDVRVVECACLRRRRSLGSGFGSARGSARLGHTPLTKQSRCESLSELTSL